MTSADRQCGIAASYLLESAPSGSTCIFLLHPLSSTGTIIQGWLEWLTCSVIIHFTFTLRNEGPINWKNVVIYLTQVLTIMMYDTVMKDIS